MKSSIAFTSLVAAAAAQRPANESICDYYTTALLKNNTAANQQTLLTLVVNTAVIGNYTTPNVGIAVPGILTAGTYKGVAVNLLPYFDGALDSTNNGGSHGVSMNFLDGGGAAPLKQNKPADNNTSAQYVLLTHLYEYFAVLLGCSQFGSTVTPYAGDTSMYDVHKYMGLGEAEFGYFVTQVGLSAASFGVTTSDVDAVAKALEGAFGMRCAAPAAIPTTASAALQAICIESSCPMATSADCSAYSPVTEPMTAPTSSASSSPATVSSMMNGTTSTMSSPATMTSPWTSGMTTPAMTSPSPSSPAYNAGVSLMPVLSAIVGAFGLVVLMA